MGWKASGAGGRAIALGAMALFGAACVHVVPDGTHVLRAAGPARARPATVGVLPFVTRNDDALSRRVTAGCRAGVGEAGADSARARLDAAMAQTDFGDLDDARAAATARRAGVDAVIVGTISVGHFGSVVSARLVRADTGATDATAETGGNEDWADLARRACAALLR